MTRHDLPPRVHLTSIRRPKRQRTTLVLEGRDAIVVVGVVVVVVVVLLLLRV